MTTSTVESRSWEVATEGHPPGSDAGTGPSGMPALRELLADKPGPQTSLNRVIGQDRTLATVRSSLELVEEVAHRTTPP